MALCLAACAPSARNAHAPAQGAQVSDTTCADEAKTGSGTLAVLAYEGLVVFRQLPQAAPGEVAPIELVRYRDGAGCQPEPVDRYGQDGGPPHLEAAFIHAVQGVPNLFAIVSWPIWHAGEGIRGTRYDVYAYRSERDTLVSNEIVTRNQALYGGFVGTVGGAPSTFEGTTRDGVVAMLHRLGLD